MMKRFTDNLTTDFRIFTDNIICRIYFFLEDCLPKNLKDYIVEANSIFSFLILKDLWKNSLLFCIEKSIQLNNMHRRRRNLISDINVVPYIDVMLVLLVIFMIAAPLMVQGVLVNLPEASSDPLPVKSSEPLIVSIKDTGSVYLEIQSLQGQELSLDQLNQNVSKLLDADPSLQVVIRGDGKVEYEKVMVIMAQLQTMGAKDIGLITKEPLQ